nr:hypothetical protein BaRGS_033276 [Batillaria attramentaria]
MSKNEETADVREMLELQLAEVEMLESMFANPGEFVLDSPEALQELRAFIDGTLSYECLDARANFYIEKDLAKQEAHEGRECQLCSKGKQAKFKCVQCHQAYCAPCRGTHDSIESCTQHTILPLDGDGRAAGKLGEEAGAANEKKCPKHKNQLLLLFCRPCQTSICMQCKLTSHDGHDTEDVVDTGARARGELQEESNTLAQREQLLKAVLSKVDDFYGDLEKEKLSVEQAIRDRSKQLQAIVAQAEEEALHTVQTTAESAVNDLTEQAKPIKERHATVTAKRRHIEQVVNEGEDGEAVSMLAKLRSEAELSSKDKSSHGQASMTVERSTVSHGFRARAVRYNDVLAFIGTAREGPLLETKALSVDASSLQESVKPRPAQPFASQFANAKYSLSKKGVLQTTEIIYSKNPKATLDQMCLTAGDSVWLVFNPGGDVKLMALFDDEGRRLETLYHGFPTPPLITCDGDAILSLTDGKWANFYVEKDLAKQETVEGLECQLCSKGTQAKFKCVQCQQVYCSPCRGTHDSIESCTDHTILPLDGEGGGEKQGAEGAVNETKCPKHKNQMRLLFCCRCETSICIQCKLTSHDGHETEDVVDAGTKAKAQLKEESDLLDQRRQLLEAVLAKTDDFCDDLEKEKQAAEKEIRERACQLQDMVSQAQEEALRGVQSTAEMAVADIKEQANPFKETHAAIMAKRSHINQVIEEGNADEAVGLLAKLRAESDGGKKWKGQDKPVIQRGTLTVEHRPKAVRNTDIMSFIGRAKEGPLLETKAIPPEIDNNVVCTYTVNGTYNFDVSADGTFYAFCTNPLNIYDKLESTPNLRLFASYNNPNVSVPTDVCFCVMDGREVLLVAFQNHNTVHVVDHRDAGCFIRTLESDGCKLDRPMQLETNNQGRVWVGCYGGKVVVFDL